MDYSIFDPTGNITALVESPVIPADQPAVASALMRLRPEVEQVGFLREAGEDGLPSLRMAGGEFCGNASLSAAALLLLRGGEERAAMRLRVSGAAEPVEIRLQRDGENYVRAEIKMPPALEVMERDLAFEGIRGRLPLVRMGGISHLIVEQASPFFPLLSERGAAERAVQSFCTALGAEGLGLLFIEGQGSDRAMTPLVYIPGSGTVFWENSCASGSAAVGIYAARKSGVPVELLLREPGGTLCVRSDPDSGETRLSGGVRFVGRFSEKLSETC